jgi:hypothetical protein
MSNTPASPERGALRGADLFQHEAYDRHREALAAAVQDGLGVDLFVTPGNELHPVQHHWRLWVPWESARGQSFKAVGAKDGYMDHAVAIADARQQFVCWSEALPRMPRFFRLVRLEDVSGVSGVGHIADGVQWHDRSVPLRWRTSPNSTGFYNSMEDVQAIHGHDGRTLVEWYTTSFRGPNGMVHFTHSPGIGEAFVAPVRAALALL